MIKAMFVAIKKDLIKNLESISGNINRYIRCAKQNRTSSFIVSPSRDAVIFLFGHT